MRCAVGWGDAKTTVRTLQTPARMDRCRSWWIAFHFIPHCDINQTSTSSNSEKHDCHYWGAQTSLTHFLSYKIIHYCSCISHFHILFPVKCLVSFLPAFRLTSYIDVKGEKLISEILLMLTSMHFWHCPCQYLFKPKWCMLPIALHV